MRQKYSRHTLIRIYRRYARSVGWNDHPKVAEQRAELWLARGADSVDVAIQWHEEINKGKSVMKLRLFLFAVIFTTAIATIQLYLVSLACEQLLLCPWNRQEIWMVIVDGEVHLRATGQYFDLKVLISLLLIAAVMSAKLLLKLDSSDAIEDRHPRLARRGFEPDSGEPWAWERLP